MSLLSDIDVSGGSLQRAGAGRPPGPRASASVSSAALRRMPAMRTEKVLFGKQELQLPEVLVEDMNIFMEVISPSTWKNALTDSQRRKLLNLLPTFPENDVLEKQETLRNLFEGENFKFGNPLRVFHRKLRDGLYSPDIAKYTALCRRAKLREYRYQQQAYYASLLKEVLVNRQRILEQVYQDAPERPLRFDRFHARPSSGHQKGLHNTVACKINQILKEVNEECAAGESSSGDEEGEDLPLSSALGNASSQSLTSSPDNSQQGYSVEYTLDVKPAPSANTSNQMQGTPVKRPRIPYEFTEQDLAHMISRHKKRKKEYPDHPELDTRSVSLEDILTRCNLGKKTLKAVQRRRVRVKSESKKGSAWQGSGSETPQGSQPASRPPSASPAKYTVMVTPEDELPNTAPSETNIIQAAPAPVSATPAQNRPTVVKTEQGVYQSFFSLLRNFVCEEMETKATTSRIEERVKEWQESPSAKGNSWFGDRPIWSEVVWSALKFLSGDVLGLKLDNFIPLLDYKERAQQWKWIGDGRDSDAQLDVLYVYWRDNAEAIQQAEGGSGDRTTSPPPPRQRTSYVVRPTTVEERNSFHDQEEERFTNPHKAYTFNLHGYESVVGPVKGVFEKESSMNKAREHALLVSDRPSFVTILTLVRDAAARLPNGEGTRADICELLKDSQYLAKGVTDAQINTVVSGALDRLHYEKDPCVKYDVNRKLWIYLHRNRSEQDFERVHEAERAAAKAKKALGKSKPSKKSKETPAGSQSSTSSAVSTPMSSPTFTMPSPALSRQASVLSAGSTESLINVETVSPNVVSSPRTAGSGSPRAGGVASSPLGLHGSPLLTQSPKGGVAGSRIAVPAKTTGALTQVLPQAGTQTLSLTPNVSTPTAKPVPFSLLQAQGKVLPTVTKQEMIVESPKQINSPRLSLPANTPAQTPPQRPLATPPAAPGPRLTRLVQQLSLPQHTQLPLGASQGQPIPTNETPKLVTLPQPVTTAAISQSPSTPTGQTIISTAATGVLTARPHLLQSATIGGSSILIGGKQALLSGKPIQIGGTSLQLISSQPGGSQIGMVQGLPAGISIVTQASSPMTSATLVSSQSSVVKATVTSGSQVLQLGAKTATPTGAMKVGPAGAQVRLAGAGVGSTTTALTTGARVLTQRPGGGLVLTQIPQAAAGTKTGAGGKALTVSQANLLAAGQQILVQQAGGQARVVTPQHFLTGGLRPAMLAASTATAVKPGGQNIQLVKTVLSQSGDKTGQTTILLTQPMASVQAQSVPGVATSGLQLTPTATKAPPTATPPKAKAGPVYARIITPPPGIRLAAVRPGQVVSAAQVSSMTAGVNVIQALGTRLQAPETQHTGTDTPSSSDSEHK